jgi:DNA/RNA-binding domain of Phe-tRNA-synthetase-like protein
MKALNAHRNQGGSVIRFSISEEVRARHPGTKVAATFCDDLSITKNAPALDDLKDEAVKNLRNFQGWTKEPPILAWRTYYASMGIDPEQQPPAPEALVRRIASSGTFPTINSLVDSCNLMAIRHLLPIGAFNQEAIEGNIALRLAQKGERMIPIGSSTARGVQPGEVVYADGQKIFSRYSRDADSTKVTVATRNAFLVVDATSEQSVSALKGAVEELVELVTRVCGGAARYEIHVAD